MVSLASLASGSTVTPPSTAKVFSITGTTTINAIASTNSWDGREVTFIFAGALTITHSSNLALPGSANITTAANDVAMFVQTASGAWRCAHYLPAASLPATSYLLLSGGTVAGDLAVNGNTTLGNAGTDTVTTNGLITANGPVGAARLAIWNGSYSEYQLATVTIGYVGDRTGVLGSGSGFAIRAEGQLDLATGGANVGLSITSDRRVYGSALHNNAGSVTGTTNQYIASGTYTPTLTNVSNTSITPGLCQWIRVGNVVTVSGTHSGSTPVATLAQFRQSLPIASNFTVASNCGGMMGTHNGFDNGPIIGDATNDAAFFEWQSTNTGTFSLGFSFTYVVL